MYPPGAMVQIRLRGYEGPVDLLLQLLEKRELEIATVSLVEVVDQYLQHVERLKTEPRSAYADALAEFLVIGGRLLLLKARALLPREGEPSPGEEDEDDPGRELVDMLTEYRRYRDAVTALGGIDRSGLRSFRPGAPPPREVPAPLGLPDSVTLELLTTLVREALSSADQRAQSQPQVELERDPVTVAEKIVDLQRRLRAGARISFRAWIAEARTRIEVIVTFLAVLELYKSLDIELSQDAKYGDILLTPKTAAAPSTDERADEAGPPAASAGTDPDPSPPSPVIP